MILFYETGNQAVGAILLVCLLFCGSLTWFNLTNKMRDGSMSKPVCVQKLTWNIFGTTVMHYKHNHVIVLRDIYSKCQYTERCWLPFWNAPADSYTVYKHRKLFYWLHLCRHPCIYFMSLNRVLPYYYYYYYYKRVWLKCHKVLGLQEHFTIE